MTEYANYIITAIGLLGFYLAGKKVWWCWYVNIFNQALWFTYGVATDQWGFVVGTFFYTVVFVKNAISWTRDHYHPEPKRVGTVEKIEQTDEGLLVTGRLFLNQGDIFAKSALKGISLGDDVPIIDKTKSKDSE